MHEDRQNRRFGVAIAATTLLVAIVIALLWGRVFMNNAPQPTVDPLESSFNTHITPAGVA